MKIDKIKQILKILLNEEGFKTIAELAILLDCSERSVHNYLNDTEFKKMLGNLELSRIPNKGVCIIADTKSRNQALSKLKKENKYTLDYFNDFSFILLKLMITREPVTVYTLSEDLYRSVNSIYDLLKNINLQLKKYHCEITNEKNKGLFIDGKEEDIRELFFHLLNEHSQQPSVDCEISRVFKSTSSSLLTFFQKNDILNLTQILDMSEKMLGSNFCDEDYNSLLIYLVIVILRNEHSSQLMNSLWESKDIDQEYYCATLIKCYLERDFNIQLDDNSIYYISLRLASTRKKVNREENTFESNILDKFLNLLGIRLNIDLNNDYELRHNLILHLLPAIKRMKHGVSNKNPLLEQIRIEYTEVYISVITAIEDLERMENIHFDSNELGYICLHIIAAINRPNNLRKTKCLLICTEGLSIEIFLKNLIESYFKEIAITDIQRDQLCSSPDLQKYDLIIDTTNSCQTANTIQISTSFNSTDLNCIRHYFTSLGKSSKSELNQSFKFLSFFKDDILDQTQLIKKYCALLEQGGYVTSSFYDSVLARIKVASTYVARGIAVPHGSKEEVKHSIITAIQLNHSIMWDDEECDFVILVALNDDNTKESNTLFRKIMKIAASNTLACALKKCTCLDEVIQLLNQ